MRYETSLCSHSHHNIDKLTALRPSVSSTWHHSCSGTSPDETFHQDPTQFPQNPSFVFYFFYCVIIFFYHRWWIKIFINRQGRSHEFANTQYTPPTPTRRNCRVASRRVASRRRCEHNSQLAHDDCRRIQSTIWKLAKQTTQCSCLSMWLLIDTVW